MALELRPRQALPASHRFVLAAVGWVGAVFWTGKIGEQSGTGKPALRFWRVEYPLFDAASPRSFATSCETGSASLLFRVWTAPVGKPRLFGFWVPTSKEGAPLGFVRATDGLLELGRTGTCGVYGTFLRPGSRVELVLREREPDGTFGSPIETRFELPPA
jgi:hypothetical protein